MEAEEKGRLILFENDEWQVEAGEVNFLRAKRKGGYYLIPVRDLDGDGLKIVLEHLSRKNWFNAASFMEMVDDCREAGLIK
jgi:hypothetical protein